MHRLLASRPHGWIEAAATANAGWYSLPDLGVAYPQGLGGIGLAEPDVMRLLTFPLDIFVGDEDTGPDGPDVPPAALAQGKHRLARAHYFLAQGQAAAAQRGVNCPWRLVVAPGIGHKGKYMSHFAGRFWFGGGAG